MMINMRDSDTENAPSLPRLQMGTIRVTLGEQSENPPCPHLSLLRAG